MGRFQGRLPVLVVNLGGRAREPQLREEIKAHRPKVVVCSEAQRATAFLREFKGYRLRQGSRSDGAEAPGVAVLVRRRMKIRWERLEKMRKRWWGPFTGRIRWPRVYRKLTVWTGGVRWPLYAAHLPPGGPSGGVKTRGRNKPAWDESARRVSRWLKIRRRAAVFGDLNATLFEVTKHIGRPANARVDSIGKVTHAVTKGARVRTQSIKPPKGLHGWGLFVLTKGKK